MKRIIFLVLLTMVSMYYTHLCIGFLSQSDPLMVQIASLNSKYTIPSINASLDGNTIIPGRYGRKINKNKSYSRMKRYGVFNETLMVTEEVKPTISIDDVYDKYIMRGSSSNKSIALVFIVNNRVNDIYKILKSRDAYANFFIDGRDLDKYKIDNNYQTELLGYGNRYDKDLFNSSLSYLKSITNRDAKFCYSEDDNDKLLSLCSGLKLHTIKPSLIINSDLIYNIKKNISNSIIIKIDSNSNNIAELGNSIDYIRSKGYSLVSLDRLISEN